MTTGRSAGQPLARRDMAPRRSEGADLRASIGQMLGHGGKLSPPFTKSMAGPLAGLLIAKWAGYAEAEREAVAAFEDRAFAPELPDELRRPAWERPIEGAADAVVDALKNLTVRHPPASPYTRYLVDVAPLVTSAAEREASLVAGLLEWVHGIEMDAPAGRDVAAGVFEETLRDVVAGDGRDAGERTTPAPVADLMLELANPVPGEKVYDPCFGFGGLLVGIACRIQAAARTDSLAGWGDMQRTGIFGVEKDRVSYAIGLCRTLLAGIEGPRLAFGDALDRALPDSRSSDGFDCVLAAPPWGRKTSPAHPRRNSPPNDMAAGPTGRGISHGQFVFPSRDVENLFLQHVMANLCPGGRAVVALPDSTLYRSGADREVRKALLSSYCVDAVISLPAGAFAPYTNLQASLLLFRCHEPRPTVRFVEISPKAWNNASADGNEDHGRGELPCRLATLVQHHELTDGAVPQGVEAWDVPLQELAGRDYELIAKQTGYQALQAELERIVAADRSLKVERLDAVAEVRRGLRYERCFTTGTRPAVGSAPGLLRVGDIRDTGIRTPSLFLNGEGEGRPKEDDTLRAGDVVVTTSGVVGKVGLISDAGGGVGSLATSNMAVVRVQEGLTPHFVAALLRSPTYQNWLSGHARGAVVRHLSVRTLRSLPVPVPPVPVQDVVIGDLAGTRGDALAALARLLAGTAASPLSVWLETPFVARLAAGRSGGESDRIGTLSATADALLSLVAQSTRGTELASTEGGDRRIGAWLDAARQAAAALDGVASIPRGAGRLAVIEVARSRLNEARHTLDAAEGATVNRLRSFTRAVIGIAEEEVRAMQESVTVGVGVEPAEVVVGIESEVRLRLANSSAVPLRNLVVETRPAVGNGSIAYLAEGAACDVPLTVRAHDATRALRIVVSWRAHRLDGTAVGNEQAIELHVRSTREAVRFGDLGASPYIVGSPVDRQEMFFGRADVIECIRRQVGASTHANVILLEGNRRTGKTTILRQLGKPDALPGWVTVDCSLQDAEGDGKGGVSTCNLYRLLARRTGWALYDAGVETWFPQTPDRKSDRPFKLAFLRALDRAFADEHPFETFEVYMAAAIQAASPRRVLLMLDEFDKLQEGIDAGVTSPQAPENIRHLLQNQAGLSAIITGSRRLKRLREEYWSALFGLGYRIGISALSEDDARRLVTEPVAGRLKYLPHARDRVVELTSRHPFLVQSLCNQVFERAAAAGTRTVTADQVMEAATEMVRDNEHFRTLWDYAGTERRRLLLALCDRLSKGPDAVNLDLLELKLDEVGVQVHRRRELADDIAELRELELIDFVDSPRGGSYRMSLPLMAKWLQENVDFSDVAARAQQEAMETQP